MIELGEMKNIHFIFFKKDETLSHIAWSNLSEKAQYLTLVPNNGAKNLIMPQVHSEIIVIKVNSTETKSSYRVMFPPDRLRESKS